MSNSLNKQPAIPPHEQVVREKELYLLSFAGAELVWSRCFTAADRSQFNNDFAKAYSDCRTFHLQFWKSKRRYSNVRTVVDLAHRIDLLSDSMARWVLLEYGEMLDTLDEALDLAIAKYRLVLVNDPRSMYWHGQRVNIDWAKRRIMWIFLDELVRHAKQGLTLHADKLRDKFASGYLDKQKSRLSGMFDAAKVARREGFFDLIKSEGRNACRLVIDKNCICILDVDEHGSVGVNG